MHIRQSFANFVDSFNPPSRSSDAWPRTASWPAAELGPGARSGDHTQATASLLGVYLLDIYWLIFKQRAEQSKTH